MQLKRRTMNARKCPCIHWKCMVWRCLEPFCEVAYHILYTISIPVTSQQHLPSTNAVLRRCLWRRGLSIFQRSGHKIFARSSMQWGTRIRLDCMLTGVEFCACFGMFLIGKAYYLPTFLVLIWGEGISTRQNVFPKSYAAIFLGAIAVKSSKSLGDVSPNSSSWIGIRWFFQSSRLMKG